MGLDYLIALTYLVVQFNATAALSDLKHGGIDFALLHHDLTLVVGACVVVMPTTQNQRPLARCQVPERLS